MAVYVWTGTTDGAWNTTTNWTPNGTPGAGDTVIFDGRMVAAVTASPTGSPLLAKVITYSSRGYAIGTAASPIAAGATAVELELPPADGSAGRGGNFCWNFGSAQTTVRVHGSATTGSSGLPPINLIGTHASNKVTVLAGSVTIGNDAAASTVATLEVLGPQARVDIGSGVTLTSIDQDGGWIRLQCAATTVTQDSGSLITEGSGAITTLYARGNVVSNSSGTITNLYVEGDGLVNFDAATTARTVTNATVAGDRARISDRQSVVTFTNGVILSDGAESPQINFGTGKTLSAA